MKWSIALILSLMLFTGCKDGVKPWDWRDNKLADNKEAAEKPKPETQRSNLEVPRVVPDANALATSAVNFAAAGNVDEFFAIVKKGADLDLALLIAIERKDDEATIRILGFWDGIRHTHRATVGKALIKAAELKKKYTIAETLVDLGASLERALITSIVENNLPAARKLLEYHDNLEYDLNFDDERDERTGNALRAALVFKRFSIVKDLIKAGATVQPKHVTYVEETITAMDRERKEIKKNQTKFRFITDEEIEGSGGYINVEEYRELLKAWIDEYKKTKKILEQKTDL